MLSIAASKLVSAWFAGEYTMFDACSDEPELAWEAILAILASELTAEQEALLAAGPLETLLSMHGPAFVDRVERQAISDLRFNHLLGGVWRCGTVPEIWERVRRSRRETW